MTTRPLSLPSYIRSVPTCCVPTPDNMKSWLSTAVKVGAFLLAVGGLATATYYSAVFGASLVNCGQKVLGGIVLFGTACVGISVLVTPLVGGLLLSGLNKYSDNKAKDTLVKLGLFAGSVLALPAVVALLVISSVALIAIGCCCLVLMANSRY